MGSNGIYANPNNQLFQHEYGHYLQSQASGPTYLFKYALPSFIDTWKGDYWTHTEHWAEQDANRRAWNYFDSKNLPDFKWNSSLNPIYNAQGGKIQNIHDDNGKKVNPKWWKFGLIFGGASIGGLGGGIITTLFNL